MSQKLGTFIASENAEDLSALRDLIESGKIAPAIDRTYPLSQTPAAIRHVQEGRARGKVVVSILKGRAARLGPMSTDLAAARTPYAAPFSLDLRP